MGAAMTDRTLSPNTQAIYDAFNRIGLYNEPSFETDRKALAAALRAVVQELKYFGITEKNILAIAAELDGAND
jgi:hypothetical protein